MAKLIYFTQDKVSADAVKNRQQYKAGDVIEIFNDDELLEWDWEKWLAEPEHSLFAMLLLPGVDKSKLSALVLPDVQRNADGTSVVIRKRAANIDLLNQKIIDSVKGGKIATIEKQEDLAAAMVQKAVIEQIVVK